MTERATQGDCLPIPQVRVMIRSGEIIPLVRAVNVARSAASGEVIDSRLCGAPGSFRYVVTFLGQDGRVVRVMIDAGLPTRAGSAPAIMVSD